MSLILVSLVFTCVIATSLISDSRTSSRAVLLPPQYRLHFGDPSRTASAPPACYCWTFSRSSSFFICVKVIRLPIRLFLFLKAVMQMPVARSSLLLKVPGQSRRRLDQNTSHARTFPTRILPPRVFLTHVEMGCAAEGCYSRKPC